MEIREVREDDLKELLRLYDQFHKGTLCYTDDRAEAVWRDIIADKDQHIIVAVLNSAIVSSCVLIIVPNLTNGGRPYGLIENVITDENHRNKGHATAVLNAASVIAVGANCYKIMLMTGSKEASTLRFYERAGYNRNDKTAFIQWL